MDKVIKNKNGLELVTSLSSGFETSSKKIYLLVTYYQIKFDGVLSSSSWVIPKFTPTYLCKPIHGIINYSTSICSESGKSRKEEEKIQQFEYF